MHLLKILACLTGICSFAAAASISYVDSSGNSALGLNVLNVRASDVSTTSQNVRTSLNDSSTAATTFNPIMNGFNVYAPSAVKNGSVWNLYYGGWITSSEVNDRIYLAVSQGSDLTSGYNPTSYVAVSNGSYIHVNDPAVVKNGSSWVMAYSGAAYATSTHPYGYSDWINISTSSDGAIWTPSSGNTSYKVTFSDPSNILGGGTIQSSARPALAYKNGTWYMWFDGFLQLSPSDTYSQWKHLQYMATSTQGTPSAFTIQKKWDASIGDLHLSEMDVKVDGSGNFRAAYIKDRSIVYVNTSSDGINWSSERIAIDVNNHYGVAKPVLTNPGLAFDSSNNFLGVFYSGTSDSVNLTQEKIYLAYNLLQVEVHCTSPSSAWAVYGVSGKEGEYIVNSFGYSGYDWIKITNPLTGTVLLDQSFSASPGQRWQFNP